MAFELAGVVELLEEIGALVDLGEAVLTDVAGGQGEEPGRADFAGAGDEDDAVAVADAEAAADAGTLDLVSVEAVLAHAFDGDAAVGGRLRGGDDEGGVSIRFTDLRLIGFAAVFCLAVYLLRVPIVRFIFRGGDVEWKDATLMTFMVPKGLVSAVLASIPIERGIPGAEVIRDFTYMVVLISVCMTAVLIPVSETKPLASLYQRLFGRPVTTVTDAEPAME